MSNSMNDAIVIWASGHVGKTVDNGECWDLANRALLQAHAKTSNDLGPMGKDADYVWGDAIPLKDVQAGDILQMRDFAVKVSTTTTTSFADGTTMTSNDWSEEDRPHHTAIVERSFGNGKVSILEQNFQNVRRVVRHDLFVSAPVRTTSTSTRTLKNPGSGKLEAATVQTQTTIAVTGQVWAYRPSSSH